MNSVYDLPLPAFNVGLTLSDDAGGGHEAGAQNHSVQSFEYQFNKTNRLCSCTSAAGNLWVPLRTPSFKTPSTYLTTLHVGSVFQSRARYRAQRGYASPVCNPCSQGGRAQGLLDARLVRHAVTEGRPLQCSNRARPGHRACLFG